MLKSFVDFGFFVAGIVLMQVGALCIWGHVSLIIGGGVLILLSLLPMIKNKSNDEDINNNGNK